MSVRYVVNMRADRGPGAVRQVRPGPPRWAVLRVRSSIVAWAPAEVPTSRAALIDGLARRTGVSRRLVRMVLEELTDATAPTVDGRVS
ncbi:MAG: hypothetical protein JWN67_3290 [Actinomycetia bacterium]|nr:hypothetical protein [Actinomycetes bacterium]